ncbi:MAG: hypothetical protein AAGE52_19850 [Myxococcota bacterium]
MGSTAPPSRRDRFVAVGLFVAAYLYVFPYYPGINNPNENVRVYMTAALVEEGSYEISTFRRRWGWTNDAACVQWPEDGEAPEPCARFRRGSTRKYYSVKAPFTSWLGVPAYAAIRALYGDTASPPTVYWWLRVTASGIPMAVFFWFFYGWLGRRTRFPLLRDAVYLSTALGSVLLGYAYLFVSHSVSAAAAFGAFMLLARGREEGRISWTKAILAGFLATSATALEYPCFLVTFALCVHALFAIRPWPRIVAFGLGALLPTLLVMHFQASAYGNPFTPGHLFVENEGFRAGHESGLFGADQFRPSAAVRLLFDLRLGLFTTTPLFAFVLLAPMGVKRGRRVEAWTAGFGVLALYLVICTMNNWTGGWSIGPRYLVVAIPFVATGALLGLDWIAQRRRRLAHGLALGSAAASLLVSQLYATYPHLPDNLNSPMRQLYPVLVEGGFVPTNAGMLVGLQGVASMLPFALLMLGALWWASQRTTSPRRLIGAIAIALLCLVPHAYEPVTTTDSTRDLRFIQDQWRPHPAFDPPGRLL